MPRKRSQSARRAVVLGIVGVVFGLGLLVGLSVLANRGSIDISGLAPKDFYAGQADEIFDSTPFILPDVAGGSLDVYLQHVGEDLDTGWVAISVLAPDQDDRDCALDWSGREFVDPCTRARFPADGTGLDRYQARVEDGAVYVDFTAR